MLGLGLLLLQEVDDEGLIVHYKVVRQTLGLQVITEMVSPVGIERFEGSKLRRPFPIGPVRSLG